MNLLKFIYYILTKKTKYYHFYFDEGGMIGNPRVLLSNKLLKSNSNYADISNYYFGYLSEWSIIRHLQLWHKLYPSYLFKYHKDSVIKVNINITQM